MEWITYSWLSCCASAPSVAALTVWVLFIFHTYRRRWRTIDIFLLTIALQEIPSSLCAFGFAVHTVIRSRSESSCHLVIWGLTTTRVFQLTTLTSLAFDRALTLKWPYKYRFSVRHSQIRYHIVVLGVISSLVGVAGLFARLQYQDFRERLLLNSDQSFNSMNKTVNFYCTLHPLSWDFRYNVFISTLYAILALITLICTIYIEIHRFRGPTVSRANSRISSVGNLVGDQLGSTDAIGRCESYRTLYGLQTGKQFGSINKKILDDQRAFDLRWASVIGSLALCYALNHGPYLAFMITGLIVQFWNPLHDNIVIWFGVIEGMILPIALYITDDPFRDAVKRSFKRKNYRCSDVSKSSDGPFPLYFNDFALIDKPYVGAMSSIPTAKLNTSPLTVVSNYRRSSVRSNDKHRRSTSNDQLMRTNGCLSSLRKCKLPKTNDKYMFLSIYGVDKVIPVNKQSIAFGNESRSVNPYYKNSTTLSTFAGSDGSIDGSIKKEKLDTIEKKSSVDNKIWYSSKSGSCNEETGWEPIVDSKAKHNLDEDHIYATLSETFSVRSTLPDKRQLQQLHDQKVNSEISSNERIIQNSIISLNQNYAKSGTASVDGLSMSGVSFTTIANDDFEFTKGEQSKSTTIDRVNNDDSSDRNDSTSLSSGSYSVDELQQPKAHVYDNLAFEYEKNTSIVRQPNSSNASGLLHASSSVSAINYIQRRYSPFVQKSSNSSNYYKRRGRQSFSTSDINKLDSNIYSLQPINSNDNYYDSNSNNNIKTKRPINAVNHQTDHFNVCSSAPRKTLSETNLLLSTNNKSGSLTRIDEQDRQEGDERVHRYDRQSTSRQLYNTQSSDSIDSSGSTTSSLDLHNKLADLLKRKSGSSSPAIRQNCHVTKAKPRTRSKKYKTHKRDEQIYQKNEELVYQKPSEKISNNMYGSQSVWSIEAKPVVSHKGINRIGSYAQEWYLNKSMPDLSSLSSLASCPSPVFSPLYKKDSKSIGPQTKE